MAFRHILSTLAFALSLAGTHAQITASESFTDEKTGITFQQGKHPSNGYAFGIALPEVGGSDFIGRIAAPIGTSLGGWGGFSLTSSMTGGLLVVAYPKDGSVVGSLRKATGYAAPDVYSGNATIKPIADGISADSTGFTYTFLCEGCVDSTGKISFLPGATAGPIGWAMSTNEIVAEPTLGTHTGNDGAFGILGSFNLADARSAEYATWAALASDPVDTTPGTGNSTIPGTGNSTTPGTGNSTIPITNGTVTVSNATYDYIVVGGGASGIVTAQRLVESGASVLLLERGGESLYVSGGRLTVPWNDTATAYDVPGMFFQLSSFPGNDAYCSDTPQMAGCILGGGTAVNGMAFIRPSRDDFGAAWPTGWQWDDVEVSANKVYERNPGATLQSSDGKYYDYGLYDILSKELAGAGWNKVDTNDNPNDKVKMYGYPAANTLNGLRAGPVRTYLPLAQGKANFKLQLHTKVIRAVRTNSTITGVEVVDGDNQRMIINVNQGGKVILAAGSMSSGRVLFNSAIGPADQINVAKSAGVTLPEESAWIESPVGAQVRDHTNIMLTFKTKTNMTVLAPVDFSSPSQTNIDLFAHGSGPLAQSPFRLNSWRTVTTSDGSKLIIQTHCWSQKNNEITVLFLLTKGSTSVGKMTMASAGNTVFSESPYLQTDTDKEAMALAIEEWLAIARQANSTITYTGSANATGEEVVKTVATSAGTHMTGMTMMGTDDGTKGGKHVVDPNCKVYGTDNLFVVDAGMHPDIPTGNTMAIVMVAAEHAVQKILALGTGATTPGTGNSTTPVVPTSASEVDIPSSTIATPVATSAGNTTSGVPAPTGGVSVLPTGGSIVVPTGTSTLPVATQPASSKPATPTSSAGAEAPKYGQCGGKNWTGATKCADRWKCTVMNDWYSQCVSSGYGRRQRNS
ncbi:carbohydrate-binding module family 1 protein [Lentithecium fluviatile CBS 122367]|uniref:Carbohydrate-binding module family 1 protein n=1 Tax=Lentithecium fluviatile CBS 122367 TaxID=1168545 RepID=A0A6G1JI70_9PLEO|nr:carbohydrate-binding module family 1 protein [Lentithecium fluviatile CBS 122367]